MALISSSSKENKGRLVNVRSFIFFLILCFLFTILLIYLLLPGFFSGPIIERIPIIIEEADEVINLYGSKFT